MLAGSIISLERESRSDFCGGRVERGNASQNLAAESISAPLSRFRRSSALAGRPPHGPSESLRAVLWIEACRI